MTPHPFVLLAFEPDLSVGHTVELLRGYGCEVELCSGLDVELSLRERKPDVLIAAIRDSHSVRSLVAQSFRAAAVLPAPLLVLSANPDTDASYSIALESGADNFLPFPSEEHSLRAAVRSLLRRSEYRRAVIRDAEARFSNFFENAAVGMAQLTPSGEWLRVNERLCQLLGYTREELVQTNFQQLTYPPDLESDLNLLAPLLRGQIPSYRLEKRYVHRDGHIVWGNLHVGIERDETGQPKYLVSVIEDITDRKEAGRLRELTEERLTAALDASATGTFRWDLKNNDLIWDDNLKKIFGFPPQRKITTLDDFTNCLHSEDRERVFALLDQCRREGSNFDMDFRILWPDGSVHWIADRGRMFLDPQGQPDYMTGACLDISARKREAEERAANEERLRLAFRSANAGSFDWDICNDIARWSPEMEALYGLEPGSYGSTLDSWGPLLHPDDREAGFQSVAEALKNGEVRGQWRIIRPDGEVRWINAAGKVYYDETGQPLRMLGVNMDITAQKTAEQTLRERALIIDQIRDAIVMVDADQRITLWNRGAERIFGYTAEQAKGQDVSLVYPRELSTTFREVAWQQLKEQGLFEAEGKLRRRSGELFDAQMSVVPLRDEHGIITGAVAYIADVTQRKRTEHALRISEKLAATGRLASTLAHEINNPLASVTNILYLLSQIPTLDDTGASYVKLAEAELARVSHITRNLLSFQRENREPQLVDAPSVLDSILELYEPKFRLRHINVTRTYRERAAIRVFPGELKQVISNLVENALDATPDHGNLHIRVKRVSPANAHAAPAVQISVADTGRGIESEHLAQIFEPFFTTKGEKGTGLGLWVTRDIVSKQGGRIRVRSRKGSGSIFSITLPLQGSAQAQTADR